LVLERVQLGKDDSQQLVGGDFAELLLFCGRSGFLIE
jgi:hypothetical protein